MKNYLFSTLALMFAGVMTQAQETTAAAACDAPAGFQIQRTSDTEAMLNAADQSAMYDLYIKPAGATAPTASTAPRPGFNDLTFPFTSTELVSQFGYDVWVRTDCGNGSTSAWEGPFYVATYEACSVPNVTITRTSDTDATFNTDSGTTFDYYVVLDGQAGPAPTDYWTGPNNHGRNDVMDGHTRTDLAPQFGYDVYYRKQCNDSQVSDWAGPIDVDPYVAPCTAPDINDIMITRISDTQATIDGLDNAFTYQGTANRPGRPLRDRPMYGMENMSMPHTQSGLTPAFDYDVWVRTDCGDGSFTDWTGPVYVPVFSQACEDATNVVITRNGNTGTVTADRTDQTYDLYVVKQGNAGPAANATPNRHGADDVTFPYTRNDLAPQISYDVYVRTQCDPTTTTAWVGPFASPATSPMKLSPNPTRGMVKMEGADIVDVQVIDMTGKTRMSTTTSNNQFNVDDLAPGQYIIQMTDAEGNVSTSKLMKK